MYMCVCGVWVIVLYFDRVNELLQCEKSSFSMMYVGIVIKSGEKILLSFTHD